MRCGTYRDAFFINNIYTMKKILEHQKKCNVNKALVDAWIHVHLLPKVEGTGLSLKSDCRRSITISVKRKNVFLIERRTSLHFLFKHTEKAVEMFIQLCKRADAIHMQVTETLKRNNEYNRVDMGTGVLWADKNVGAYESRDMGSVFTWGDPIDRRKEHEKESYNFNRSTYKYTGSESHEMIKYRTNHKYKDADNMTVLEAEDDTATQIMGKGWRTPTFEEFLQLKKSSNIYTYYKYDEPYKNSYYTNNYHYWKPVIFYLFESKNNGNVLIFPFRAAYWTASLSEKHDSCAWSICPNWIYNESLRWRPMNIRGVADA